MNDEVNEAVETIDCPYCAEPIRKEAKLCKHCKKSLDASDVDWVNPPKPPERELTAVESAKLNDELARNRKGAGIAYLLWFLLVGAFGAHKIYLDRPLGFFLYLFLWIAAPFTMGLTLIGVVILWIIDGCTLPAQVMDSNEKRSRKILAKYE